MGHSQTEKTRNHDRIVEVAARRIREAGTEAPGVAEIMAGAGLTHGGFYKHFGSRDELIAEAAEHTYAESERAAQQVIDGADDPLAAFVDWYLSAEHRDDPGSGCSVVALGNDVGARRTGGQIGLHRPGASLPRPPRRTARLRRCRPPVRGGDRGPGDAGGRSARRPRG